MFQGPQLGPSIPPPVSGGGVDRHETMVSGLPLGDPARFTRTTTTNKKEHIMHNGFKSQVVPGSQVSVVDGVATILSTEGVPIASPLGWLPEAKVDAVAAAEAAVEEAEALWRKADRAASDARSREQAVRDLAYARRKALTAVRGW